MTVITLMRSLLVLPVAVLVSSCAAPKAVAVAEPPKSKSASVADPGGDLPKSSAFNAPEDGIRLPDNFLSMPADAEFRATVPTNTSASRGAVTARPPSDPVIPNDIGPKGE